MHGRSRHLPGEPPRRERHVHPERCRNARCERAHVGPSRPRLPGTEDDLREHASSPTRRRDRTHRCSSRTTSPRRIGRRRRTTGRPMQTGASGSRTPWISRRRASGAEQHRWHRGRRSLRRPRTQVSRARTHPELRAVHREPEQRRARAAASRWDGSRPETRPAEPDLLSNDLRKRYARPFQGRA